jgi:glucose-1-phosphate thymidylyltransferase
VLRGPLVIGEDCTVEDAYIGPFTSIHSGVVVRKSEIEHSIILEKSSILNIGVRIESSLVGRNSEVKTNCGPPKATRFMVGDFSQIEIC